MSSSSVSDPVDSITLHKSVLTDRLSHQAGNRIGKLLSLPKEEKRMKGMHVGGWKNLRLLVACVFLLCGATKEGAAAAQYVLRNLGYGVAYAISDNGQVAGFLGNRAFKWDSVTGTRYLGTLPGDTSSYAYGINNSGQVVGYSVGRWYRAFVWDAIHGIQELQISGREMSFAYGINDSSQVVGYTATASGFTSAFIWDQIGGIRDIGLNYAWAINSKGQVAGELNGHASVWNSDGTVLDLGTLPGCTNSVATSINDSGEVAGYSYASGGILRGFLWRPSSGMQELIGIGGSNSKAWGVNVGGQVVGYSYSGNATVWDERNGAQTLGPGVAWSINHSGQVAGYSGHSSADWQAAVWTPVPEPPAFCILLVGCGGIACALLKLRRLRATDVKGMG